MHTSDTLLVGCDFSSSPTRKKPIVITVGRLSGARLQLLKTERIDALDIFEAWLAAPGPAWVGGFDLPFGLPRELVQSLGWPTDWGACMDHYQQLSRADIRSIFAAFCNARPVGQKFAHRATDRPAGSSPSMKWVNPPVAYMLHAGVPRLRRAGVHMPGLMADEPCARRVALDAYPGLLAREVLGRRSYKSDDRARQTPERCTARQELVAALEAGHHRTTPLRLGLRLDLDATQREMLVQDASGDTLDAVLCMAQAGWALQQHLQGAPRYGLPAGMDPLEGWIITA